MSNKLSPKGGNELCHKLVLVCDILIDTLDELDHDSDFSNKFEDELDNVRKKAVLIMNDVFEDVHEVRTTTYIQEVSKKVDTLIRKNMKTLEIKK